MADTREKLIRLLDYVEQVVRLDERVAFRISEFRLTDGSTFVVGKAETQSLPSVRHDLRDDEGPVWLEVERLARREPPPPPKEVAAWILLPADPTRRPEARPYRIVTVSAMERDSALAKGEVRVDDVLEAPKRQGEPKNAIIRFSMQFYPEKMLPLRVPAALERLDPPLIDIYVPHGRRERNSKINHAEADVIVEEVATLVAQPGMRQRSIGIISLIGAEQAEYIRSLLSEKLGEEVMQRHAILCGDSATFQGSERDIVFLSMVADPAHKTALTVLRYEQRFNVAVSRARDRVVLVRSVRREELNPADLKAKLIAHFEDPMPGLEVADDVFAVCESDFERDLMRNLVERGYRVQGQVGSLGYRIDMVVEGASGARLAIECDGDRYHGPEQWRQDMRRQRVLERVGWRFWRCFASSYYRDTASVIGDLVDTMRRFGIEPVREDPEGRRQHGYTERRVIEPSALAEPEPRPAALEEIAATAGSTIMTNAVSSGVEIGDRVIVQYSDDMRRVTFRLTDGGNDTEKGMLSATSPLGRAILGAEEGDEVEFRRDDGHQRRALIVKVEKKPASQQQGRTEVPSSWVTSWPARS